MKNKNKKSINNITSFGHKKREKGNGLIILLVAGFIFLTVFTVLLSFLLMNKKDRGDYKEKYIYTEETPQQIIDSSRKAMKNIKTVKFDGEMETNILVAAENQAIPIDLSSAINLALVGYADETDLDNIKTSFNLDIEMDISSEGGSEEISLNMDCITIGKDDPYYKLNNYDLGMIGMMLGHELNEYKGKWLAMEMPDERNYDFENNSASLGLKEVDKIYAKYELLKFEKDLGDKKLGSVETYHYKMKLDSADLADLIEELQSQTKENNYGIEYLEKENKEKLLSGIFENIDIELWIGKKDKLIYQVKVVGDYDTEDFKRIASKTYGETGAKKEDENIKSRINSLERGLEYHYKTTESYDDFSVSSYYYTGKMKPENVITNKDSYAIWKEMVTTTDKWCVDSTGKSGYTQEEIKNPVCPKTNAEPQGEKRNYEEYAYNLLDKEMGQEGKIEVRFNLHFSFSDFNRPLRIEKPKDVERITEAGSKSITNFYSGNSLLGFGKDVLLSSQEKISEATFYEDEDIQNDGYVMGESVSIYDEFERLFELFDFLR